MDIPIRLGDDHHAQDYATIKRRQHWIRRRVRHLRRLLGELPWVSDALLRPDRIGFGCRVVVEHAGTGARTSYLLVVEEPERAAPGEVSVTSATGRALLDPQREGVAWAAPALGLAVDPPPSAG